MTMLTNNSLSVSSPAFDNNGYIPAKYTCQGDDVNPPIAIGNIPDGTLSLALILDDPDAPSGTFVHWVTWNIPVEFLIGEHSSPGTEGENGAKKSGYYGPCPPSGTHHYHFKVYALDTELDLKKGSDKAALEKAMQGHILSQGEMIGLYSKS